MHLDLGDVRYIDVAWYKSDLREELKILAREHLNVTIKDGYSPIILARAKMALFLHQKHYFQSRIWVINCLDFYSFVIGKRMENAQMFEEQEEGIENSIY
jgi:hypothetical protein